MLLALAVSVVVLQFIVLGSDHLNWRFFLPMPVVFAALCVRRSSISAERPANSDAAEGVLVEVFAALVAISPAFLPCSWLPWTVPGSWAGRGLRSMRAGRACGRGSDALIWRGSKWAMMAAFVLSLLHWLVLAQVDPLALAQCSPMSPPRRGPRFSQHSCPQFRSSPRRPRHTLATSGIKGRLVCCL